MFAYIVNLSVWCIFVQRGHWSAVGGTLSRRRNRYHAAPEMDPVPELLCDRVDYQYSSISNKSADVIAQAIPLDVSVR